MKQSYLKFSNLLAFAGIVCLLAPISVLAKQEMETQEQGKANFYAEDKAGYYWYKDPALVEEEENEKNRPETPKIWIPDLNDYSESELMAMHPSEFSVLHNAFFDKALMNPSEGNVYEYLYVLDVAGRKSHALASATEMVSRKYGRFDKRKDAPYLSGGKKAEYMQREKEMDKWFAETADDFVVLFFTKASCVLCDEMGEILEIAKGMITYETRSVQVEFAGELLKKLGIRDVPSVVLLKRGSEEIFTIARSADYAKDMKRTIYRASRYLSGLSTPSNFTDYDYQIKENERME